MMNGNDKTIGQYIAFFPKDVQTKLRTLRVTVKKLAPKAEEAMSYGIPTFKLNGNLVHFAAYPSHIGFYPGARAIQTFKKELTKYKTSKGTIQFPIDKALPLLLIRKIIKYRVTAHTKKVKKS